MSRADGLGAIRAEVARRAAEAAEQARDLEALHTILDVLPVCEALWDKLRAEYPRLFPVPPAPPAPAAELRAKPTPVEPATELAVMAQLPARRWTTGDIRTALGLPTRRKIRSLLGAMAAQGQIEAVRETARHVFYQLPAPAGAPLCEDDRHRSAPAP
ncbi:hypothetical protein ACFC1R_34870 [Kitasatospora sp. NPDC056138]|uniref:hypothetical protein n=1 Tax=Kitasatospora sp. NPDC056138 TaxID=3345724 RepID=UPI0035E14F5A